MVSKTRLSLLLPFPPHKAMQKNIFWLNVGTALGIFKRLCQDPPRDMKVIRLSWPCTLRRILPHNLEDLGLRRLGTICASLHRQGAERASCNTKHMTLRHEAVVVHCKLSTSVHWKTGIRHTPEICQCLERVGSQYVRIYLCPLTISNPICASRRTQPTAAEDNIGLLLEHSPHSSRPRWGTPSTVDSNKIK